MKRAGGLYRRICTHENLALAFVKAAGGKHDRVEVCQFKKGLNANLYRMRQRLLNHDPDIGNYRYFMVFDPKPRKICAAAFPERVLHHGIMNVCEPVFERHAVFDSHACRRGKGNFKALDRALGFARGHAWYLKLDVKKYFDSVDHSKVMAALEGVFKDRELLGLFGKILSTYDLGRGRGLPIGNLISQHLANFYLGGFDHWVKEDLKVKGYVRYMDDILVFGNSRREMKQRLGQIETDLEQRLSLELKSNVQLNRTAVGIPFLGYRITPGGLHLSPGSRRRFVQKFKRYTDYYRRGVWCEKTLARHMEPLIAVTRKALGAKGFRAKILTHHGDHF